MTAADIAAFGELTRDRHKLHTNEAYCHERGFTGIIAHGLFGLALMEDLKTEPGRYANSSIASLGWDKIRFRIPVMSGDKLYLRLTFTSKRASRQPDRGVVTEALELVNQRGEIAIDAEHASLVQRRAAGMEIA